MYFKLVQAKDAANAFADWYSAEVPAEYKAFCKAPMPKPLTYVSKYAPPDAAHTSWRPRPPRARSTNKSMTQPPKLNEEIVEPKLQKSLDGAAEEFM